MRRKDVYLMALIIVIAGLLGYYFFIFPNYPLPQERGGCIVSDFKCVDKNANTDRAERYGLGYPSWWTCYDKAICGRQHDGECGWKETTRFKFCRDIESFGDYPVDN